MLNYLDCGAGAEAEVDPNLLDLISLQDYPLAKCNDGTPAVYYRHQDNFKKNYIIFLRGGGFCVPFVHGMDCDNRCRKHPLLCSAYTDPQLDMNHMGGKLGSSNPVVNPVFHDFEKGGIFLLSKLTYKWHL